MAQSARQRARRQVQEAAVSRMRLLAVREARLTGLAVDVVTAIATLDRAEQEAAEAVGVLLGSRSPWLRSVSAAGWRSRRLLG